MTATTHDPVNPMVGLYARLRQFGLNETYVRRVVLPSWWEDECGNDWGAYTEALMLISRHMGLTIESLRTDKEPHLSDVTARFKKRGDTEDRELSFAKTIAYRAAEFVALGVEKPFGGASSLSGPEIRDTILGFGNPWVDFENLLEYCWSIGLPVLFIDKDQLPPSIKCMEGMAANIGGQPVIVLCKKERLEAWMLFILAHEIGHVMLGHLSIGEIIVDQFVGESDDGDEIVANKYALSLLTGNSNYNLPLSLRRHSARKLAALALDFGSTDKVCPGHLALNYAYRTECYAIGRSAVKLLESNRNARDVANDALNSHLDWSAIPADSAEFLSRLIGSESHDPSR